jgi:putative endopeptidase
MSIPINDAVEGETMRSISVIILLALVALSPSICWGRPQSADTQQLESHGVNLSSLDKTCKPCQDFYHYANGEWLKNNPIPPDHSSWSTFQELRERNRNHLRAILEHAAADHSAAPGSNEQKIGDFYASCMNEPQVNADGVKPLQPEFQRIADVASLGDLEAEVARLQSEGVEAVFDFGRHRTLKIVHRSLGGLIRAA